MAPGPTWTAYRGIAHRDGLDFEPYGTVQGWTQGEALNRARALEGAPEFPVVAHVRCPGALTVPPERPVGATYSPRRTRRHDAHV